MIFKMCLVTFTAKKNPFFGVGEHLGVPIFILIFYCGMRCWLLKKSYGFFVLLICLDDRESEVVMFSGKYIAGCMRHIRQLCINRVLLYSEAVSCGYCPHLTFDKTGYCLCSYRLILHFCYCSFFSAAISRSMASISLGNPSPTKYPRIYCRSVR